MTFQTWHNFNSQYVDLNSSTVNWCFELEKEHFIDALISSALAAKDFNEEDALSLELNWKKGEWMLSKEALIAAKSFYVSQIKEAK